MNGFDLHNQTHTSASSINLWADCPHMWISQYLYGKRTICGSAAKSGILVEEAIANVIARGFTIVDATKSAVDQYNKFTALSSTDSEKKRGEAMVGMISLGVDALKQYGEPEYDADPLTGHLKQKKIEIVCNGEGWSLPIIGYLDFYFPRHGLVIDLKSTMRMPSEMSDSHRRQACIYRKAMNNHEVKFLYISGKKSEIFDCPDLADTLSEIKNILNRQEKFLALGAKETLREFVPINTNTFYHDADITKEVYGF